MWEQPAMTQRRRLYPRQSTNKTEASLLMWHPSSQLSLPAARTRGSGRRRDQCTRSSSISPCASSRCSVATTRLGGRLSPSLQGRPGRLQTKINQVVDLCDTNAHDAVCAAPVYFHGAVVLCDRTAGKDDIVDVTGQLPRIFRR